MEESAIKGVKLLDLNDSVADAPKPGILTTISVEGYSTSLPKYYVKLALVKNFASCGQIISCYVPRDFPNGLQSLSLQPFRHSSILIVRYLMLVIPRLGLKNAGSSLPDMTLPFLRLISRWRSVNISLHVEISREFIFSLM
ncbi:PREDICTED: uncharacterized protein LOC104768568 [Camelina sativa]|uniref:Uncharacterized protein LOC104768568 n=1 Tax=Camelina sativa TaxID=90675 RepID=A0ABM0XTM4_CAMSA|nr:PREDICTED: uncharacterized protein LOC104768568 [Camelina sativa]